MLSFAFNVRMSEKLHMDMDIYLHACSIRVYLTALLEYALLEYIPDCSIRVYRFFNKF